MNLLVACLALGFSLVLVLGREEVHHIHAESGRNVHVHLHEADKCEEKVEHHHHHDDHDDHDHGTVADVMAKPMKNKKKWKKGKKNKMMSDASETPDMAVKGEHPAHHEGDDDIHIHIHEAGENCTHHGDHDEHRGMHRCGGMHRSGGMHHGGHMGHHGRGGHACAMCARAISHHDDDEHDDHGRDHPGHHGPHSHDEGAENHDHSEDYVYAHCELAPNTAVPKKKRSKVTGTVHLRQLIYGGPVEMKIDIEGFKAHKGTMQHVHGMHVHEFGDLSDGCQSTGSHFNPFGMDHGSPTDEIRHAGDYGNIQCNDAGITNMEYNDSRSTLIGHHNIIGRAIVIHEKADDMGKGGAEDSLKTGAAGGRLSCCIIVRAKPHGHWESHVHDHSGDHHHGEHADHGDHKDHDHEGHGHGSHGSAERRHKHHGKHMGMHNDNDHSSGAGHKDHDDHKSHGNHGHGHH